MNPLGINDNGKAIDINSSSGLIPMITNLNDMKASWNGNTEGTVSLSIIFGNKLNLSIDKKDYTK